MTQHTYFCALRWADVDVYGVINNVAFVRYLEEARVDLILCMAPSEQDSFLRRGSVVVRHEIDYKNPLSHRREPVAAGRLSRVRPMGRTPPSGLQMIRRLARRPAARDL